MLSNSRLAFPAYHVPYIAALHLALALLTGHRVSFLKFSRQAVRGIHPPPQALHPENIPASGPALLLVNHYYRPGFSAYWIALAISAMIPAEVHWVMASAWTYPNRPLGREREALTRWLFRRIAGVFGFTTMPPMPPRPHELLERAAAVRRIIDYAKTKPNPLIALAPEGRDPLSGSLELPAAGAGRFILQLYKLGLSLRPIGVFEEDGYLWVNFAPPLYLDDGFFKLPSREADFAIRQVVMQAIAACLPPGR